MPNTSLERTRAQHFAILAAALLCIAGGPAYSCSVSRIPSPEELVAEADGIYRVRADDYASTRPTQRGDTSTIRFVVVEVIKGIAEKVLLVPGILSDRDDWNDRPVPYDFVRPAGRHGDCVASTYGKGREFLLFVRGKKLYPASLAPVNEQVRGKDDPWVHWVKAQVLVRNAP